MDWRHDALCRGASDPEVWFPLDERDPAQVAPGKAACAPCPVAAECLAWALDSGQDAGVWGGLSSPERRALRVPQRLDVAAAAAVERRAREDARRDALLAAGLDPDRILSNEGDRRTRPARPRHTPSKAGSPRSRRPSRVGRCGECGLRVDLRADGTAVRHDRVVDTVSRQCDGTGALPVGAQVEAPERVHGDA